ncbi:hypothetical protein [Mycoplasma suis]|uniref:Uncharacterized protein n=1 Tax=Mycoplasma suis (strain Illinois) TaxID=768700 RepID=F0QQH6_MYCSL|nr:hypothetical protein [Mycoplasma suis]ADX97746.1 hypothetical protein MSU_0202 [Mycoplasma suis str. Illinois]
MIFKGLGGFGWSLIIGISSAVGVGGYGAISYLGQKTEENINSFEWKTTAKDFNPEISSAHYISKENDSKGKEVCKKWVEGKVKDMSDSECKSLIKEKWESKGLKRPSIWIESDQGSIESVLLEHFSSNDSSRTKETFKNNEWKIGDLLCKKENKGDKVEVNCSEEQEELPSN